MTLTDQEISKKVRELQKIKGPVYAPLKYFRGLNTLKDVETRYTKMKKKTYTKFSTDKGVKTRTSSYTKRFREKYHLDDSLPVQFGYFLKRLFTLDLIYFQQERPIWPDLVDRMKVTITINLIVFFLIYLFAVPL